MYKIYVHPYIHITYIYKSPGNHYILPTPAACLARLAPARPRTREAAASPERLSRRLGTGLWLCF